MQLIQYVELFDECFEAKDEEQSADSLGPIYEIPGSSL